MSHSQFHRINWFILRHAWLNLWDKHMTTGRINQVTLRVCDGCVSTHCTLERIGVIQSAREYNTQPHTRSNSEGTKCPLSLFSPSYPNFPRTRPHTRMCAVRLEKYQALIRHTLAHAH